LGTAFEKFQLKIVLATDKIVYDNIENGQFRQEVRQVIENRY
jgi:hypothetical protein